jgi:hypothetical protein
VNCLLKGRYENDYEWWIRNYAEGDVPVIFWRKRQSFQDSGSPGPMEYDEGMLTTIARSSERENDERIRRVRKWPRISRLSGAQIWMLFVDTEKLLYLYRN